MNVFVSRERVTAIDLDTLALREREMDIAYFLAQTAIFGDSSFMIVRRRLSNLRNEFLRHCGDPRPAASCRIHGVGDTPEPSL